MRSAAATETQDLLSWESLGTRPATAAFRESLTELIARPREFFSKMARRGGLHEPLTFFIILLCTIVVLSFPAALAHFGVTAPDPAAEPAAYRAQQVPAQVTGLLLVLLPLAAVVAAALTVVLGSLFHAPGKLFAPTNWEGSVSVWLYSVAGALAPVACATALVLVVSLPGYLLTLLAPATEGALAPIVKWWAYILLPSSALAGLVLLLRGLIVGCINAFETDVGVGLALALSGLLLVLVLVGGAISAFLWWTFTAGLIITAAVLVLGVVLTVSSFMFSRRVRESA